MENAISFQDDPVHNQNPFLAECHFPPFHDLSYTCFSGNELIAKFKPERINDTVSGFDQSRGSFVSKQGFQYRYRLVLTDNLKCFPSENLPS